MTDIRDWLAKRAELEAAASCGKWFVATDDDEIAVCAINDSNGFVTMGWIAGAFNNPTEADAEWIADARTSSPAMRKALEAVLGDVASQLNSNDYLSEWERGYRAAMLDVERLITNALGEDVR